MRRWLPPRLAVVALVLLAALVLAIVVRSSGGTLTGPTGLSDPTGSPDPQTETVEPRVVATYRGLPAGVDEPAGGPAQAAPGGVVGADGRLAVYAAGSSTCPWLPVRLTVEGEVVTVLLAQDGEVCTTDLAFTTSVVALPDGVDPDGVEVEVVLDR